jgi:phage baseplate assembly protein W
MTNGTPISRDFLGTGWAFPIRVNGAGGLDWVSAEQDVQRSIWLILSTARGERQMRPDFGCGIHDFVFADDTPASRSGIAHQVRKALVEYEPRIDVIDVRVEAAADSPATMFIDIDYRLRANNAVGNLVYPFYITEGQEG